MRKRITFVVLMIATLFLFMPMAKGKPFPAVRYYKVYWNVGDSNCPCIVGPPDCSGIMGEWTRYCDDTWEGHGHMPGDFCTHYDVTIGEWCDF